MVFDGRLLDRQLHYLLTHVHNCDVAKQGTFSFNSLRMAFRWVVA